MASLTHAAFDCIPAALLITDPDGRVRHGNEAARRLLVKLEAGDCLSSHLEVADPAALARELAETATPQPRSLRVKSGSDVIVSVQVRSISDGTESAWLWTLEPDYPAAMSGDAFTRTHLVEQLSLAVHTAELGIWQFQVPDGPLQWNARQLQIYGLDPENFAGDLETWRKAVLPEDSKHANTALDRILQGERVLGLNFRIRRPDGVIRHILASGQAIIEDGRITDIFGVNMDITNWFSKHQELRDAQKRFEAFMDHFPGYAFLKDASLKHVWANSHTLNDLGLTLEDFQGTTVFDLFDDAYANRVQEKELRILETGEAMEDLASVQTRKGQTRWERDIRFRIQSPEGKAYVGGIAIDVTDLQTAKLKAEAASTTRTQFLSSLSHELRTPLNPILGFSEVLVQRIEDPSLSAYARNIQLAAEDLLSLISDILDFTTLDLGELKVSRSPAVLEQVLRNIERIIAPKAEAKHLAFRITRHEPLPDILVTDEMRLRQILLNLLTNAVKFTAEGTVTLAVRQSGRQLCFAVTDTGPGIPQEQQEAIFHHFHQIGNDQHASNSGVGLGLGIARLLTRLLDSELTLDSEPGAGSTFTLHVPVGEP